LDKIPHHRIGSSFALVSPVTGAIVLTNEFGMQIRGGVAQNLTADQIAQQIAPPDDQAEALTAIQTVINAWIETGLLTTQPQEFPDPVVFRAAEVETTLMIGGPGGTAACQIPDPILAEQVNTIVGHMAAQPDRPIRRLTAQTDADGFAVFRDGQAVSGRIELDAARFVLLREIAETACGPADVAAVFHAGCVALNDQALIICGDSGRGKSTLTFGLVAAGCDYLGDDHVPLHRNGKDVVAFPTAAGVKPGSWNLAEIVALQERYGLTPNSPRVGVRYLPLQHAGTATVGQRTPVRALIFPQFRPHGPLEMTRIPPEQALIEALRAGSRLSDSHRGNIAPLAEFLNDTPAYRLAFSSSDQSVPACLELLTTPQS